MFPRTSRPTFSEFKELMRRWDKSTFDTLADSIRYHHDAHGDGRDVWQYLRVAANFNTKRHQKETLA